MKIQLFHFGGLLVSISSRFYKNDENKTNEIGGGGLVKFFIRAIKYREFSSLSQIPEKWNFFGHRSDKGERITENANCEVIFKWNGLATFCTTQKL